MRTKKFGPRRLYNEEWFSFHKALRKLIEEHGAGTLGIARLCTKYFELLDEVDSLIDQARKSELTPELTAMDEARLKFFRSLRDVILSYMNFPEQDKRKAAQRLFDIITLYSKGIFLGSQPNQTASISNLVQDLTGARGGNDVSEQVKLLGLTPWVEALRDSNNAYEETMQARNQERSKKRTGRLVKLRGIIDHHYTYILSVIGATLLAIEDRVPTDEPETDRQVIHFAHAFNATIANYKVLIEQRKTKRRRFPVGENAADTDLLTLS